MRRAGRTPAMQQAGKNYPRAKRTRRSLRREPVLAARALIPKSSLITASRGGQHFPLKYYRYGKEREYPRFLENYHGWSPTRSVLVQSQAEGY